MWPCDDVYWLDEAGGGGGGEVEVIIDENTEEEEDRRRRDLEINYLFNYDQLVWVSEGAGVGY